MTKFMTPLEITDISSAFGFDGRPVEDAISCIRQELGRPLLECERVSVHEGYAIGKRDRDDFQSDTVIPPPGWGRSDDEIPL